MDAFVSFRKINALSSDERKTKRRCASRVNTSVADDREKPGATEIRRRTQNKQKKAKWPPRWARQPMGGARRGARLARARSAQSEARNHPSEKRRERSFSLSGAILSWRKMLTKKTATKQAQDGGGRLAAAPAARAGSLNKFCLPQVVSRLPWRFESRFFPIYRSNSGLII